MPIVGSARSGVGSRRARVRKRWRMGERIAEMGRRERAG
jgi:hypothetical protein